MRGNMAPVGIVGLGAYVPPDVMTNDDWAEIVDTSDEWITTKTGIKERRIAAEDVCTSDLAVIAPDTVFGSDDEPLLKVNPLASWTSEKVWTYLHTEGVPTNTLHDQGYRSIGCAPCTRPVTNDQHEREGRWWWEDEMTRECGLHVDLGQTEE